MFAYVYSSPIGDLTIAEKKGFLTAVAFGAAIPDGYSRCNTSLIRQTAAQLKEYFAGCRKQFDLPLAPEGTAFQQKVWAALQTIPYGTTVSYLDIAVQIGNARACRAVGMANHNNPVSIIIPCHRVIGKNGSLVGYGGGLDIKTQLLKLEQGDILF